MKYLLNNKIIRIPASVSPYAPVHDTEFLEPPKNIPEPPSKIRSTPLPSWKTIEKADKPSSTGAKSIKSSITPLKRRQGQASSDVTIGALLAQEDEEGIKRLINYFSRTMGDAQLRYPKAERACLVLVQAIQRFRHYLLSNRVVLVAKADPIKFLLSKPALIGRPTKWLLQMSEFDIACVPPKEIKGQAVADLLAAFPGEDITMLHEEVPGEFPEISIIQEEMWLLYFDGSATPSIDTGGAGIVLKASKTRILLAFHGSSVKDAARSSPNCQTPPHHLEVLTIHHTGDWREPYIKYLRDSDLPSEKKVAIKLVQKAKRFAYLEGILYRKSFGGSLLRCLAEHEIPTILKEMHEGEHQRKKKLFIQIHEKYYWPTMEDDAAAYVRKCHQCQVHGNLIHTPCLPLNSVSSPWPFYSWGLAIIGKINPSSSKQHEYIITATKYFTKWVEAIPLRNTTGITIAAFIKEHIICIFGIPKHIITDNGGPFANKDVT
ncbi:uncharacterized protein LOC113332899 [Papaver somniferum]|uniref:uncharacterized protein LOC113332899 n=1 Tax=Papaver somniferum TaxID=3469 RepID=UPI000E704D17|nr:uncharacterized protein LOC113332899 [Papaver somniferum]